MKIVYVYPQFARHAGTERVLIDKMNYLAEQKGYEVLALTTEQGNHPIVFSMCDMINHVDLDVRYCELYKLNRFFRLIKKIYLNRLFQHRFNYVMGLFRPDIVIATTYNARFLSVINNCPIAFKRILESHIGKRYLHQNDPTNQINVFRWLKSWFGMLSVEKEAIHFDVLVALNQADADEWSKFVKSVVISNVAHLNPMGRYGNLRNKRVIFVGRFSKQKGIKDLLKIWKLVYNKHPDWQLDLFGEGELLNSLMSEVSQLNINISIHKPETNIFERYIESSILVMTSLYEPFGLVIPEAMSCGLPVVAFDCPSGPANIISDGVDGYLINNRDINAFADKVCYLIEHQNVRLEMGSAAVQSSLRYAPEYVIPKWKELFLSLLSEKYNNQIGVEYEE